mgnify:CR=1 FL=1
MRPQGSGTLISRPALSAGLVVLVGWGLELGLGLGLGVGLAVGVGGCSDDDSGSNVNDNVNINDNVNHNTNTNENTNATPPVAEDDELTIEENGEGVVEVLANDSDPEGEALTVIQVGPPARAGRTTLLNEGRVRYVPFPHFNGTDTFTYTIQNESGGQAEATDRKSVV